MMELIFSWVCHQIPERTFLVGGHLLPCCQRCTGLYLGALVVSLIHLVFIPPVNRRAHWLHGIFLLVMIPFGFHWVSHGAYARLITGALFVSGVGGYLWLIPAANWDRLVHRRIQINLVGYSLALGLGLALIITSIRWGGVWLGHILPWLIAAGGISLLVLAVINLVLLGIDWITRAMNRDRSST